MTVKCSDTVKFSRPVALCILLEMGSFRFKNTYIISIVCTTHVFDSTVSIFVTCFILSL